MADYRFALEKGARKSGCPSCGKMRLVRYMDTLSGEQVADHVGRCDREDSCGYHLTPREHYLLTGENPFSVTKPAHRQPAPPQPPPSFIDADILQRSLAGYEQNHFCRWLCGVFGEPVAFELTERYRVGTSKHWAGASVFWQIDSNEQIRGGKIMLYNAQSGRRVKTPFNYVHWVHKVLKIEPYHLQQCLFGQHLLLETMKPVAIVESEKTAIVASGFIPEFIWLATAGKGNLNKEKLKAVNGRRVTLFPDLGALDKWQSIGAGMPNVTVSDILERRATAAERAAGLDLADFLLREDNKAATTFQTTINQ
jgi:hypothetical protein